MNAPVLIPAEGGWVWLAKPNGAVVLAAADGHTVMDCVRKGTQACAPRFANWPGLADGQPRAGRAGVMSMAHSWFDAAGRLVHPDALKLAAAPVMFAALNAALDEVDQAQAEGFELPAWAHGARAAIAVATGSAS